MNNKSFKFDLDTSIKSLYEKGLEHFRTNDLDNAVKHWEKAAELSTNKANIHSILGNAYKLMEDFEKSSKELKKAVEIEPDNFEYLYNFGLILFEQKKYEEAKNVFKKALKIHPNDYELLNDLAVTYYKSNDYRKALNYLNKALGINPEYFAGSINLIQILIETKEFEKATKRLEKIEIKYPSEPEIEEIKRLLNTAKKHPEMKDIYSVEISGRTFRIEPLEILKDFDNKECQEIDLSIVIPIKNERENIPILYEKLIKSLAPLNQKYEIILVDDGSSDGSGNIMRNLALKDDSLKVIQFRRNYGQTAALSAGFKYAHGNVIITMDGDLQNDPYDIPRLLEKMSEGYDLVSGWRKNRKDNSLTRNLPSKIANKLINKLIEGTNVQLHDFGCTLKAYKKGIVKNIHLYGEMHRFIPAFAGWLGVKVTEIPVKHHPRIHGNAKYNLSRVWRVLFDLLVVRFFADFMTRPIQFFGKIAKNMFGWGAFFIAFLVGFKLLFDHIPISYDTFLILFGILSVTSFQLVVMGLLGEIIMRVYFEGQKKDAYIVEKVVGKT